MMAEQTMGRMRRFNPPHPVRSCLGKARWSSEPSAQRAITRLRRENPDAISSTVRPYRCSHCKRWHVGHGG